MSGVKRIRCLSDCNPLVGQEVVVCKALLGTTITTIKFDVVTVARCASGVGAGKVGTEVQKVLTLGSDLRSSRKNRQGSSMWCVGA